MILRLIPGASPIDITLDNTETELRIEYTKDKTLTIEGTVVNEQDGKTQFFSAYPRVVEIPEKVREETS